MTRNIAKSAIDYAFTDENTYILFIFFFILKLSEIPLTIVETNHNLKILIT